jgi:hypothetical protein
MGTWMSVIARQVGLQGRRHQDSHSSKLPVTRCMYTYMSPSRPSQLTVLAAVAANCCQTGPVGTWGTGCLTKPL